MTLLHSAFAGLLLVSETIQVESWQHCGEQLCYYC